MFKRIVVPLDGSLRAERALPVASRLARAGSGEVTLTRIVTGPVLPGRDAVPFPTAEAILAGERETAIRYLKDVSQRPELADVATRIAVSEAAAVAPALLEVIRSSQADLVVICSHGRSGFQRWSLGAVAQKVARQASIPTLVLRSDGPALSESHTGASALVPLDGSPESEATLEPVARLLAALAAPGRRAAHLLYVVPMEDADDEAPGARLSLRQEAETYLRNVAARFTTEPLAGHSIAITWSVVFDPDVAATIIAAAEGNDGAGSRLAQASAPRDGTYDVIAMASHGRSGFQLWALGSVTERVLHASALPLLIVRSGKAEIQADARSAQAGEADPEIAAWPGDERTRAPTKTPMKTSRG
jgi:nucleotide-binding universal stress UspA family protein